MASRMRTTSAKATTQLVTMLLVTGNGPTENSGAAAAETPCASAASAGTLAAESVRSVASLVTRDMRARCRWDEEERRGKATTLPPVNLRNYAAIRPARELAAAVFCTAELMGSRGEDRR